MKFLILMSYVDPEQSRVFHVRSHVEHIIITADLDVLKKKIKDLDLDNSGYPKDKYNWLITGSLKEEGIIIIDTDYDDKAVELYCSRSGYSVLGEY